MGIHSVLEPVARGRYISMERHPLSNKLPLDVFSFMVRGNVMFSTPSASPILEKKVEERIMYPHDHSPYQT